MQEGRKTKIWHWWFWTVCARSDISSSNQNPTVASTAVHCIFLCLVSLFSPKKKWPSLNSSCALRYRTHCTFLSFQHICIKLATTHSGAGEEVWAAPIQKQGEGVCISDGVTSQAYYKECCFHHQSWKGPRKDRFHWLPVFIALAGLSTG